MGYTNYIKPNRDFTDAEWTQIKSEAQEIFERSKVPLAGPEGTPGTKPIINNDEISFNGVGDDSYETASISKKLVPFQFCKTNERPYDPVVVEVFAMVKGIAPDAVELRSDGGDIVFEKARQERLARHEAPAEIGSKFTEMSKAELAAELDRKKTHDTPKAGFANIIEHAQDVANRTGKTVLTMKQLRGGSFEGKVTATDIAVGTDRLATVEGDKAVLLVRCSPALRANQGRDVQVKTGERGASVRHTSKDLSR